MSEASSRTGVPWALRGMIIASIVVPLLVLIGGGWVAWRGVVANADAELGSALAVAADDATRVLDTHAILGARVNDLLAGLTDDAIAARESEFHNRLAGMITGYAQVTAIVVTSADGRPLVASSRFPIDTSVNFADRDYFVSLRDSAVPFFIGGIVFGRMTHEDLFTVAVRRGDPQHFAGAVLIGVSPLYFYNFDRALFSGDVDYNAALLRGDGTLLAGYPGPAQSSQIAGRDNMLVTAFARNPDGDTVQGQSSLDGVERLIAYRRLADYPVIVAIGRRWGSVVREWLATVGTHMVFGVPATLCLLLLSLLVVRRWRQQHEVFARLQDEVRRREVAEEALRQAQKMEAVGRLTGGIAHDFNNHLTVISSNIELLQHRLPQGSESLTRLTTAAMAGVQRAATLTHRLLAFSRQQPLEPEALDAGRLVSGMSDLLRRTLGEDVVVETVLASGLWQTRVDANQLENVLLNLAVNARDAMPHGGKLIIETANAHLDESYAAAHAEVTPGEYVMLSVSDTGTGMSPDVIERAFEPFFTTKPLGQGTGLGLSMVYGFVKQSGGHVAIQSQPGQGTTIKAYLPRFLPPVEAPKPATMRTPAQPGKETILVVEDDEDVRRSSVEALREIGYLVLEAGDAMDGVRLIVDRGGIDLLFTDVGLPGGVNGSALAEAARKAQPGLRVLFTTGYVREAALQTEVREQGLYFIAKPFNLTALAGKIREVLDTPLGAVAVAGGPDSP